MKFEIKHKVTGSILFSIETESWRLAIESAINSSADLSSADLSSADLSYADLSYADLRYADLCSADLSSADLIVFQARFIAYFQYDNKIWIGCKYLTISEWQEQFDKIASDNGATDLEKVMYRNFINTCAELQKIKDKENGK